MTKKSRLLLSFVLAAMTYLVAFALGLLGFSFIGAGHGSGVFGYLFFAPVIGMGGKHYFLGLVIWPAIAFLLPWARSWLATVFALVLLGFGWFGVYHDITADIAGTGTTSYARKVMDAFPDLVILIVVSFAVMQITILGSLARSRFKKNRSVDES
jgi:hypothetical protein